MSGVDCVARRAPGRPVRGGLERSLTWRARCGVLAWLGCALLPGLAQGAATDPAAASGPGVVAGLGRDERPALLGRLGLLVLERAGGSPDQAHLAGGLRGSVPLLRWGAGSLRAELGYLFGHGTGGSDAVSLTTRYHLLDLRLEGGWQLGPLRPYLAAGPLLALVDVRTQVMDSAASDLGAHPGAGGGVGVEGGVRRWRLRLEVGALVRQGHRDLLAEGALGWTF